MEMLELTIRDYHAALKNGELTCSELVAFYLDRIQRYDPILKSIICTNPQAMARARALDEDWQQHGKWAGPLHGVPVLLKDNVETFDMPTTAGSLALEGFCTNKDAPIVEKMRQAGAIILAKTNLHEFAIWGESTSSLGGQTLNPYDLMRTPGGSSGGTGAALAANFGMVGIGTDTINSIRSPSSANNLFGLRPSLGSVSRTGIVPYSLSQDTAGPMARTTDDLRILQAVISGYEPLDTLTAWGEIFSQKDCYLHQPEQLKAKRIGVLRSFFGTSEASQDINLLMEQALIDFAALGAELVEMDTQLDSQQLVSDVSLHTFELKEDLNAYLQSVNAPMQSLAQIIESGKYHPSIEKNIVANNSLSRQDENYKQRLKLQAQLQTELANLFAAEQVDAILFPHQQIPVCKVGEPQRLRNGALSSISGFPSLCVPIGFTSVSESAPLGLPVGMEILSMPFREEKLLAFSEEFERFTKHRLAPNEPF
jgi:amidase